MIVVLIVGNHLPGGNHVSAFDIQVKYDPPDFQDRWDIYINEKDFEHILETNKKRLEHALVNLGETFTANPHALFRLIYGKILLQKKAGTSAIPQWFGGAY